MHKILFIHGIGDSAAEAAEIFEKNIKNETVHDGVEVYKFFWKNLISKKEDTLKKKIGKFPKKELLPFNFNLKESIETYLIIQLRRHLIGYFGDAVFYLSESSKKVISQLESAILEIAKKDKSAKVSIVAHSLGSVIAFDALSDKKFQRKMKKKRLSIENLFTVGSPLALFLLRSETSATEHLPITGKWINIYDKRDIIASPLSPFFGQCRDVQIKLQGSSPLTAHLNYFSDALVLNEILRLLV